MAASVRPLNSWDILKLFALVLMFIDHTGIFIWNSDPDVYWLRAIGRGAAPIFLFLSGYASRYHFSWEICILGIILSISDTLVAGHLRTQNILFTILISRMIFAALEHEKRHIVRPYEWYIAAFVFIPTMAIFEYGSLGFMFALCGYVQSHSKYYPAALPRNLRILVFLTYGLFSVRFAQQPESPLAATVTLGIVYLLLSNLSVKEVSAPWCPPPLKRLAKAASYYSGYIYVGHLMILEWITKIPI